MQIRRNSISYKILKSALLGGGFLLIATIAPAGGAQIVKGLIKGYFRQKRFERERFLRDLRRLQVRDLIDYQELSDGKIKIILTKAGKKKILEYSIDDIQLDKSKKWDGQWRLIMFDIPHSKKKARDALRQKLKALNFYPIQKSVFITPYECEKEIDFICSFYNTRQYVLFLTISRFEGEEKLKHYFRV